MNYLPEGRLIDTPQNRCSLRSIAGIQEACVSGKILEARAAMCDSMHNLTVDMGCITGVIEREEGAIGIKEGIVRDIALISRVGKPVSFVVTDVVNEGGPPRAVLSRRRAQQICYNHYIKNLRCGDIIDARITHLETFGAFCDIGAGNVALLPIDAISVSRIGHPGERFSVGEDIRAIVKNIDVQGRVTLTHKELLGTWEENARLFESGQTVSGVIRSVEDYGVFVELSPNMAGLAELHTGARPGMAASVFIKNLIPEKMKVKLIIINIFDEIYTKKRTKYFYCGGHITRWRYSPSCCERVVESFFGE